MKRVLFTIGPTEMYETTKKIREKGIPYFRNSEFSEMMMETDRMLKHCVKTDDSSKSIFLTASGTGGMEATVDNLISENDKVLVIVGGGFGERFAQICEKRTKKVDRLVLEDGEELKWEHFVPFDKENYKAVIVNLHETSTGQLYDINLFTKFCKNKETLLIVDAISTFLCDEYAMDENRIDVTIISTQKGLCVSPGMSIVIMNRRTVEEHLKTSEEISSIYFDFNDYINNILRGQTPFTPAVGICYEINDMLKAIISEGVDTKIEEVRKRATVFRNEVLTEGINIPAFNCSNAITTVIFSKPVAKVIESKLIEHLGYVVNPCGGDIGQYRFRVSHVGALSLDDTMRLARAIKSYYGEIKKC